MTKAGQDYVYLPPEEMSMIYKMRKEYASKISAYELNPCTETMEAYYDIKERRDRAYRSLIADGYSVRNISAMFRSSKTSVRIAIGEIVAPA